MKRIISEALYLIILNNYYDFRYSMWKSYCLKNNYDKYNTNHYIEWELDFRKTIYHPSELYAIDSQVNPRGGGWFISQDIIESKIRRKSTFPYYAEGADAMGWEANYQFFN